MTLWRIRATVDDRPGYLSVLTASLALRGVNILTVQVQPTEQGAVDDFLVDAPDALDEADLIAAVERGRGRDCWVARSEARGLADQPTRVLGLANRLVRDPDATGEALRTLLGADSVSWRPASTGVERGITGTTMALADRRAARSRCAGRRPPSPRRSTPARRLWSSWPPPWRAGPPNRSPWCCPRAPRWPCGRRARTTCRVFWSCTSGAPRVAGTGGIWAGRRCHSRPGCVDCWSRAAG
ncbi:ACT domain-containing protein [Micromonospora parastrephiae]|uniref:ACT domain-containing protein n=1 Tax=Micromonospora parastrephiae TaxID=2806101 RepID=UPI001EE4BD59|nr:ACT domain-containing protein [Micromonospora parastrephiae]